MADFKIGTESFVIFNFPSELYQNDVELLSLDNVDDIVFRILAKRGRPFQIETKVDVDTFDDGWAKINNYTDMVKEEAKQVIFADHDFDDDHVRFKVLRVTPGGREYPPVKQALICGGINDGDVWVTCRFDMVAVEHQ